MDQLCKTCVLLTAFEHDNLARMSAFSAFERQFDNEVVKIETGKTLCRQILGENRWMSGKGIFNLNTI